MLALGSGHDEHIAPGANGAGMINVAKPAMLPDRSPLGDYPRVIRPTHRSGHFRKSASQPSRLASS
jgi:hypothetical protein